MSIKCEYTFETAKRTDSSLFIFTGNYLMKRGSVFLCHWKQKKVYVDEGKMNQVIITISLVFLIGVLPFHHVIIGAGREPTTSHHN